MRFESSKKAHGVVRLFFVLAFFPFFFVFPYFAATNNPNENTRTYMTMAIVEFHTFELDKIVSRQGWTNDMARVKGRDGQMHWHCVKGPATGYLGVPVYWAYTKIGPLLGTPMPTETSPVDVRVQWLRMTTWILRIFSVQLPCFLFLIWFERYLRTISPDPVLRLAAVAATGLGTNYLGYANMYVSHALFAVAAFWCFGLTERAYRLEPDAKKRKTLHAFLSGLCAGWVTMLEYHGLPISIVLTLFGFCVFYRPLKILSYMAGGVLTIGLEMLYQWRSFNNPLTPGHQMVENPQWASEHKRGLFGTVLPSLESVAGLSLPVGSGFFGLSPYMWLGLLAIPLAFTLWWSSVRKQRVLVLSTFIWVLCMMLLWAAAAGVIQWRAGWTLGPRRLGAAPPFFAFGAVAVLEWFSRRGHYYRAVARGLSCGLALSGVLAVGLVGIVYNTLPEIEIRPLMYFALPLIEGGFVAHDVGEWIGLKEPIVWYISAGALVLAPIVAVSARVGDRTGPYLVRVGVFAASLALAIYPQFTTPGPLDVGDHESTAKQWVGGWEPAGRDRITSMRNEAQRYGTRKPCAWYRLADLEREMHMDAAALADEKKAGSKREDTCSHLLF